MAERRNPSKLLLLPSDEIAKAVEEMLFEMCDPLDAILQMQNLIEAPAMMRRIAIMRIQVRYNVWKANGSREPANPISV